MDPLGAFVDDLLPNRLESWNSQIRHLEVLKQFLSNAIAINPVERQAWFLR
jgi:hypothetical protein